MNQEKLPPEIITAGRDKNPKIMLPMRIFKGMMALDYLSLPCFKIVYIENGAGIMTVNGRQRISPSPSVICLNDQEIAVFEGNPTLRVLFFLPMVVNELLTVCSIREERTDGLGLSGILDLFWAKSFSGVGIRPAEIPLTPAGELALRDAFEKTEAELTGQESSFWPCRARSHLIELLFMIGRQYHDRKEVPNIPGADSEMAEVLSYIHTYYGKKITIDGLAREFSTNRNTLQKNFSRVTGKSIGIYLRELRFSIARSLLMDTKLPVSTIIERTGFNDITHFGRAFRKRFGLTPASFRKKSAQKIVAA